LCRSLEGKGALFWIDDAAFHDIRNRSKDSEGYRVILISGWCPACNQGVGNLRAAGSMWSSQPFLRPSHDFGISQCEKGRPFLRRKMYPRKGKKLQKYILIKQASDVLLGLGAVWHHHQDLRSHKNIVAVSL
jgi:hypothetical protein